MSIKRIGDHGNLCDAVVHNGLAYLAGHVADNTWHPADIDSTIFNYSAWVQAQEDIVTEDDIQKIAEATAKATVSALLAADLFPKRDDIDRTVREALRSASAKAKK